ncbi:MAG TPA: amidohydrolase family protein [Longimicrobiales bacterium]|nr:amidohydrolase family protein [Longimicrobiales bacterium]
MILALAIALAAQVAGSAPAGDTVVVIRDAVVIPMDGDTAVRLPHHSVVVRDGRVAWLGPDSMLPAVADARVIDAGGRFLMPGLMDMHAHVSESYLPLFLANGITTVRDMNGRPATLALRERVRAGAVAGPRIVAGTPLLTGASWPVPHVVVPDADSARALTRTIAAAGYDFIKIYDGLDSASYRVLVEFARSSGLRVTGHIPQALGLEGVLAAGQDLEHVEKIVWATVGHAFDAARIPGIAAQVAQAGVWVTPTLFSQQVLTRQGSAEFAAYFERPEIRYVDEGTLAWWRTLRRSGAAAPQDPAGTGARLHAFQRALVLALFHAGVPLLLGTDTPNPLVVPGFGIHDEIAALVDAGMPVYDVLRAGTARAGEWIGGASVSGVVREGGVADLLLLRHDPLLDPATLRRPDAVLANGRVLDRAALDALLVR